MRKHTIAIRNDLSTLAEDARALMAATAGVTGGTVGEARQRLAATLDRGSSIFGRVKAKAAAGATSTDRALHVHPYHALALAFGVGALFEYLVGRGWSRYRD